jgi:hypothetical protein
MIGPTSAIVLFLFLAIAGARCAEVAPVHLRLPVAHARSLNQPLGAKSIVLGGESDGQVYVELDPILLKSVILKPDDVIEASLCLSGAKVADHDPTVVVLKTLRAVPPNSNDELKSGVDFDEKPFASATAIAKDGTTRIPIPAGALMSVAAGSDAPLGLLLRVPSKSEITLAGLGGAQSPSLELILRPVAHAELFHSGVKPQPGVYARLEHGHLFYGDQRLRLWGVVGQPHVDRLVKMGFNAQRVWEPSPSISKTERGFYSEESVKLGEATTYTKGDGTRLDLADRHMADLKAHGFFVMFAALQNGMPVAPLASDDSFIAPRKDPAFGSEDWADWKAAILTPRSPNSPDKWGDDPKLGFVDERLMAIRKRAAKNLLTHVNLYTGKTYGEEECIAVYEIFNENGFAHFALEGGYEQWPPYFQNKLKKRWNDWLKANYADDAALTAAWTRLDAGEALKTASVNLGPTFGKRGGYPAARSSDFVHFILDLTDRYNREYRSYCRTLAPKGVGVNVVPFSFDTQFRPNLAWNYTNGRGDVNSFGMYYWDLNTALNKPPSAYVIDNSTIDGVASILYETNQARPNPCRAEYPLKLAAIAGWQDWDGIFWHYWSPADESDESYLSTAMAYMNVDHYWTAVQHQNDPVMCSAMAIAGQIFLNHDLQPAPKPAVADISAKTVFSYDHYYGAPIGQITFTRGAKMRFDAGKKTDLTVDGAPPPAAQPVSGAIDSGEEILWDWPNGRLIIDAPKVKAYVGKFAGAYKFKDGIVFSDVNAPFVVFSMVSGDGKNLAGPDASHRVLMTAVADAHNTNFKFHWDVQGGPVEMAKAIVDRGRPPVIVDRITYSVWFPTLLTARLNSYDFALRNIANYSINGTNHVVSDGATPFMSELSVESRGAPAKVPDAAIIASAPVSGKSAGAHSATAPGTLANSAGPWRPIPKVVWKMSYADAYDILHNSKLSYTSLSSKDVSNNTAKTITITDATIPTLWNVVADIEIRFDEAGANDVTVTFKQPPPFKQAVSDLKKELGAPVEMNEGTQFERSLAKWNASEMNVMMTESQGILKIQFTRK